VAFASPLTPERRLPLAAFLTLFGILCAQELLETARDALFLTHLPAARLPWVYLGMAGITLLVARASSMGRRGPSRVVSVSMLAGTAVTAGLWVWLARDSASSIYALFLWTGVFAAWTVTQVWTALADSLDMSLAKRLYGRVSAGGGFGAVVGAGVARLLSAELGPRSLVLVAAVVMAATALGPALAVHAPPARLDDDDAAAAAPVRAPRLRLGGQPYVARLVVTALLATAVTTILDLSFKEAVAQRLPPERLASFFATFHLVSSAAALAVQLALVGVVVRVAGVGRAHLIFPALLTLAVVEVLVSGSLTTFVVARGVDAAMRSSFHRPAFELLQVPLADDIRRRAKPLIDVLGQRGGQALASIALLLMLRAALGPQVRLELALVLLALWLVVALGLKRPYVDLLRSALLRPAFAAAGPAGGLDGDARATVVAALGSTSAADITAALDLIAVHGRPELVPPRLLAHPDPAVLRKAIPLLGAGSRAEALPALDRLLEHPDPAVRTLALRKRAALAPDRARLTEIARGSGCRALRATAWVVLVDRQWADERSSAAVLLSFALDPLLEVRVALALAIAERVEGGPAPRLEAVLLTLARSHEPEVLIPVATTFGAIGSPRAVTGLCTLLSLRAVRPAARAALARIGPPAFAALAGTLADRTVPPAARALVPRALIDVDLERAAGPLLDGLLVEEDGLVRFRILRALNRVRRARPDLPADEDILGRAATAAVDSAYRYLAWRLGLEAGAERRPARRTATWELLCELLREKEDNAVERLFRVLELRYPRERFRHLLATVRSGDRRARAAGRELIENLLTGPARGLTLALVDELPDAERLSTLAEGHAAGQGTYRRLLATIQGEEVAGTLGALAAHHAGEVTAASVEAADHA
jgi:AAA family ATP:ADP antiporter